MMAEEFLIGELAQKTNVSVRTIRYYINQGLLPAPDTRGRYTVYDSEYVERIQLIKRLKDAFLPIKEIRTMLETQSLVEIEEFLRLFEAQRGQSSDALGYIKDILQNYGAQTPLPAAHISQPKILESKIPPHFRNIPYARQESTWKRIVLAPGIEVHIEQSKAARYDDLLQELFESFQARLANRTKE